MPWSTQTEIVIKAFFLRFISLFLLSLSFLVFFFSFPLYFPSLFFSFYIPDNFLWGKEGSERVICQPRELQVDPLWQLGFRIHNLPPSRLLGGIFHFCFFSFSTFFLFLPNKVLARRASCLFSTFFATITKPNKQWFHCPNQSCAKNSWFHCPNQRCTFHFPSHCQCLLFLFNTIIFVCNFLIIAIINTSKDKKNNRQESALSRRGLFFVIFFCLFSFKRYVITHFFWPTKIFVKFYKGMVDKRGFRGEREKERERER